MAPIDQLHDYAEQLTVRLEVIRTHAGHRWQRWAGWWICAEDDCWTDHGPVYLLLQHDQGGPA